MENKEQNNYVHIGETVACGHCRPDEIFELMEKYGLKCDCNCHQETKLPEGKLYTAKSSCCGPNHGHSGPCSPQKEEEKYITCSCGKKIGIGTHKHWNGEEVNISPQKEEPKEWEEFKKTNPRATLLEGYLYFREEDIKQFISQEISKAYTRGWKCQYFEWKKEQENIKQEVISLCLEKIGKFLDEEWSNCDITDNCTGESSYCCPKGTLKTLKYKLSDEIKGI